MIVRRFGKVVQSVEARFDSRAMTEIGFRRTEGFSRPAEEFFASYERVGERELTAAADGRVKDEAERALLEELERKLSEVEAEAGADAVVMVESEAGKDYPKTRDRARGYVEAGENRMHFEWTVDPPLRVGIYRKK